MTQPFKTARGAWNSALASVPAIGKDEENEQQRFKFRGMETVAMKIHKAIKDHALSIVLEEVVEHVTEPVVVRGKTWTRAKVRVRYRVGTDYDPTGFVGGSCGEGLDGADKATGKALTFAYKSFLVQSLLIAAGHEDGDADSPFGGEGIDTTGDIHTKPEPDNRRAPAPSRTAPPPRTNGGSSNVPPWWKRGERWLSTSTVSPTIASRNQGSSMKRHSSQVCRMSSGTGRSSGETRFEAR